LKNRLHNRNKMAMVSAKKQIEVTVCYWFNCITHAD